MEHTIRLQRRNTWIKWKNMCAMHMTISDYTRLSFSGSNKAHGIISQRLEKLSISLICNFEPLGEVGNRFFVQLLWRTCL